MSWDTEYEDTMSVIENLMDKGAKHNQRSGKQPQHLSSNMQHNYEIPDLPQKKQHYYSHTKEADDWHEEQLSRRLFLQKKINEYSNSFTMHGLSKIINGKSIESMFWFMMLFGGLVTCFVVIHGLVSKYLRYEIYTEIRAVIADDNYFPAITFCEYQLFIDNYFAYCGHSQRFPHPEQHIYCDHRVKYNKTGTISYKKNAYWSNGLFNVTLCRTMGGKSCLDTQYIRTMFHYNHSCFTWNYDGNLSDIYSHTSIEIDFKYPHWLNKPETIVALPHDPRAHEVDITKLVKIQPYKEVEIKLEKTIIKRLPAPFPSKCSDEKGEDIFPGKYTRRSCIESHNFIKMYQECGDTLDYVQQFIPEDTRKKFAQNRTIENTTRCIWEHGSKALQRTKECGFPCNDYDLSVIHTFNELRPNASKTKYTVIIQFQKVDTYQTIEEKQLYSWDQMLSEMGGLIGLIIGASVISVVEIFVYGFLVILKKCFTWS